MEKPLTRRGVLRILPTHGNGLISGSGEETLAGDNTDQLRLGADTARLPIIYQKVKENLYGVSQERSQGVRPGELEGRLDGAALQFYRGRSARREGDSL